MKNFKLIKDGYIFEYNNNFGHINVDNEITEECEDCIEVGLDFAHSDKENFISKCNEWIKKRKNN